MALPEDGILYGSIFNLCGIPWVIFTSEFCNFLLKSIKVKTGEGETKRRYVKKKDIRGEMEGKRQRKRDEEKETKKKRQRTKDGGKEAEEKRQGETED